MSTELIHLARREISEHEGKRFRVMAVLCKPVCGTRVELPTMTSRPARATCKRCVAYAQKHADGGPIYYWPHVRDRA